MGSRAMGNPWRDVSPEEAFAEARRRIDAARVFNSADLDFSDLVTLETLPQELATLTSLLHFSVGRYQKQHDRCPKGLVPTACAFLGVSGFSDSKRLVDISALSHLTSLVSLDLSNCECVKDFSSLAHLTRLESLHLTWTSLASLVDIRNLKSLQTIALDFCRDLEDISDISNLRTLRHLNLERCESIKDLAPVFSLLELESVVLPWGITPQMIPFFVRLRKLQYANFSGLHKIDDFAWLAQFRHLRELDLSTCLRLADLSPISGMSDLESLNLSWCESISDLSPVSGLINLKTLMLFKCPQITELTPLAELTCLSTLYIWRCRSVCDFRPIGVLDKLRILSLVGCQSLSDLSLLSGLTEIEDLTLSFCPGVERIAPVSTLPKLRRLDLSRSESIQDLSSLSTLTTLRELNLGSMGAKSFAGLVPLLPFLEELRLHGTKFSDLDDSLLGAYEGFNAVENLCSHFADLEFGPAREAEVKVFVLGNGRIGKTQLVRRLMDDPYDDTIPSTHGIQCRHRTEADLAGWKKVRVNFWDFGGQDI
jgi:internalin A